MPTRKVTFVYGFQVITTPNGMRQESLSFSSTLRDEEHFKKLMEEWNKTPRGMIELEATPEELSNIEGALSAKTHLALADVKHFHVIEKTDLELATTDNLKNITHKIVRS